MEFSPPRVGSPPFMCTVGQIVRRSTKTGAAVPARFDGAPACRLGRSFHLRPTLGRERPVKNRSGWAHHRGGLPRARRVNFFIERASASREQSEGEVLMKIGKPDSESVDSGGGATVTVRRWIYLPASGDQQTTTTIVLQNGKVIEVTRQVSH